MIKTIIQLNFNSNDYCNLGNVFLYFIRSCSYTNKHKSIEYLLVCMVYFVYFFVCFILVYRFIFTEWHEKRMSAMSEVKGNDFVIHSRYPLSKTMYYFSKSNIKMTKFRLVLQMLTSSSSFSHTSLHTSSLRTFKPDAS